MGRYFSGQVNLPAAGAKIYIRALFPGGGVRPFPAEAGLLRQADTFLVYDDKSMLYSLFPAGIFGGGGAVYHDYPPAALSADI